MAAPIAIDRLLTEDIFSLLGLEEMPQEDREEMLTAMGQTVQARVYLRASEELGPERSRILDAQPVEKIASYLVSEGIDLPTLTMEEALIYRAELVTAFEKATKPQHVLEPA